MRTDEERPNPLDGAAIDRLIDGEMSDTERRELLLQLENEPDGWRRCALAFLEDQAWRKALAGVASPGEKAEHLAPDSSAPTPARVRPISGSGASPIAASLIASTFAAGFAAGGLTKPTPTLGIANSQVPAGRFGTRVASENRPRNRSERSARSTWWTDRAEKARSSESRSIRGPAWMIVG